MKLRTMIAGAALSLVLSAAVTTALAQNGPGGGPNGNGRGYGGPPANEQERIARQEACPQGGQGACVRAGWGGGKGQGQGYRHGQGNRNGMRNGNGPRNADCPNAAPGKGFRGGAGR
jgi:hypothetical protein